MVQLSVQKRWNGDPTAVWGLGIVYAVDPESLRTGNIEASHREPRHDRNG